MPTIHPLARTGQAVTLFPVGSCPRGSVVFFSFYDLGTHPGPHFTGEEMGSETEEGTCSGAHSKGGAKEGWTPGAPGGAQHSSSGNPQKCALGDTVVSDSVPSLRQGHPAQLQRNPQKCAQTL